MKYKINLIIIVLGLMLFNSCSDENNSTFTNKLDVVDGLKTFDSYQELMDEMESVNNMTLEELEDYEDTQNFNSFGKISDLLYYDFTEDTTLTINEITDFIKNNPKYVELVIEGDTSFTPTYASSFRYIMNDDRIFKVQDTLFKVFTSGILSTLASNYNDLLLIEEKDLDDIDTTIFSFAPTISAKLSNPEKRAAIVNRERINFVLSYIPYRRYVENNQKKEQYYIITNVVPKRLFVCWFTVKRTISTNYSFTIALNGTNSITFSDYIVGSSPSKERHIIFQAGILNVTEFNNSVFTSLTGNVRQPNVICYF